MKLVSYIYRIVAAIVFGIAAVSCLNDEPEAKSIVEVGDALPYFSVVMNDGTTITTDTLRGTESMIVFFSTTCGDCRRELPRINEYALSHPEIKIVCIARSQTEPEIATFWQSEGLTMPYSPQPDAAVYNLFATSGVPRIYCAAPDLHVTAVYLEEFPFGLPR